MQDPCPFGYPVILTVAHMGVSINGGVLYLGLFYEEFYYFGSRLSAPDFWILSYWAADRGRFRLYGSILGLR